MSLNFISMGVFFNIVTNIILVFILKGTDYEISNITFSFLLLFPVFVWASVVGKISAKYDLPPKVNGMFVGLGSALVLFLILFVFTPPILNTNVYIMALWMLIGLAGGWFGSTFSPKKLMKKKQKI